MYIYIIYLSYNIAVLLFLKKTFNRKKQFSWDTLCIIQCTKGRTIVYMLLYVSETDEVYGAIFRGLISHTATQLAAFIFHACGSVTPGSPLMWQAEAQTRMRQRERRLRDSKRWNSLRWEGGLEISLLVQVSRRGWEDLMRECKKDWYEFSGSSANRWSHHLTDL